MSYEGLGPLVQEIREASRSIEASDNRTTRRVDELEVSVNTLYKKFGRPGMETHIDDVSERKSATEMCHIRRALTVPKCDGVSTTEYIPGSSEVDEAMAARRAFKAMLRHGDVSRLDNFERKSLSSFSFGSNGFLLPPERSNIVLSCLVDPTDLSGLFNHVQISAGSVKFFIDNARMGVGGWACDSACFANNPNPDLQEGLGELEIKAEPIRFVTCATSDLLQDAAFDVESWLFKKVSDGMRATINQAVLIGDGLGKPLGILNPNSGIPICETSLATPAGQFTWQDLLMLKWEIPMQWQPGSSYLMNQRTFALLMTMSDTSTRPLWTSLPGTEPGFTLAGSPIHIATQMPDVAPGATPIAYGNWKQAYMIVDRKAVTMLVDPYTAGFCTIFKFEARVGGSATCPNAARLLRIR
jgi:HK97 family phage major capsid protein